MGIPGMSGRIKICGITNARDLARVVAAGADAVGLVHYPPSPRHLAANAAAALARSVPPLVQSVLLVVDAAPEDLAELCAVVAPDLIQFHGNETPATCAAAGRPFLKALRMRPDANAATVLAEEARFLADARAEPLFRGLLLDAYRPGVPGGTGECFDWSRLPPPTAFRRGFVLSGGLAPGNVAAAITATGAPAVDVSSGVERAPGEKSTDAVVRFVGAARAAFSNRAKQTE
jgi:phosphoribosylanthranilate isomerase